MKIEVYDLEDLDKVYGYIEYKNDNLSFFLEDSDILEKVKNLYFSSDIYKRFLSEEEENFGFYIKKLDRDSIDFFKEFIYLLPQIGLGGRIMKEKLDYILALDFDGVIVDSVKEAFEVAKDTFNIVFSKELVLTQHYEKFEKARLLCRNGMDFFAVLYLIVNNEDVNLLNMSYVKEEMLDYIEEFEKNYYKVREKLSKENFSKWVQMHRFYPFIEDEIKRFKEEFLHVVIATTKDGDSVKKILATKSLDFEKIYDKDISHQKEVQIKKISSDYNIDISKIILIDDILGNLLAVKKVGAKVFMASWGYNSSFEQKKALDNSIEVLKPKDLYSQIIKKLNKQKA